MSTGGQPTRLPGEVLQFASVDDFEGWLTSNHDSHPGIWLKLANKGVERPSLSYAQALEVALCFGWIDGQKAAHDDRYWLQRFTPRSSRSRWSQTNRNRAEELIAAGRIQAAGLAEIERARADGRWDAAYAGQRNAAVPEDLQRELDRDPQAAATFSQLDGHNRYAIIWRINDAKRPETRARRIAKYLEMLRRGERIHG
jgi:uncharacterized protein YdeI (YjbR/CyaY-like superfamily)